MRVRPRLTVHEASRGGNVEAIELLLFHKADVNERTNHGKGGSPLYWARKTNGDDHETVKYLESVCTCLLNVEELIVTMIFKCVIIDSTRLTRLSIYLSIYLAP